ncbi:MAG: 23S rRNA (adenine(2503)-C(2))-methyltransferase RlmN [Candidatus Binatia bacterium]|nr:23S rRNA (adenine(2503)-C(2))-methyltransferase RlmN [Candidatus Binatia bacterium]
MQPVHALDPNSAENLVAELGLPRYRAGQLLSWVYRRGVADPEEMTDLPAAARATLREHLSGAAVSSPDVQESSDGTRKLAVRLADGEVIESVLIPDRERLTLCVSSQVGCAMGCTFCATARLGLKRHLRVEEIVGQIVLAREVAATMGPEGRPLTNLVFMGMGEPLHNLDALLPAIEILTSQWGLGISSRRITVSTVGLVPEMRRLLESTKVSLAVSLGATTEEKRRELMPVTRKYSLAQLLDACRKLPLPRRKRITFEYTLLTGENDADEDARRLVALLHGIRAKVNLIYWNPFPGADYVRATRDRTHRFQRILLDHGVHASIRESRGPDIAAACGQLAAQSPAEPSGATPTPEGVDPSS